MACDGASGSSQLTCPPARRSLVPSTETDRHVSVVGKGAVIGDGDADGGWFLAVGHARQKIARNVGEHGVGEDVVDVAGAGFDFGAALGDFSDDRGIVGQLDLVIFADAALNLAELKGNDGLHGFVAQREVRNGNEAAHKCGLKDFVELGLHGFGQAFGAWGGLGIGGEFHQEIGASVGSENDDGVLEIDFAAFAVFHHAFVEDLIEKFQNIGMSLLAFVEKNDGIGAAANGFGENASFAVTDVARRRTFVARNGVGFLIIGHVDGDYVAFPAVEKIGESQRGFRFSGAARANEPEYPHGLGA